MTDMTMADLAAQQVARIERVQAKRREMFPATLAVLDTYRAVFGPGVTLIECHEGPNSYRNPKA